MICLSYFNYFIIIFSLKKTKELHLLSLILSYVFQEYHNLWQLKYIVVKGTPNSDLNSIRFTMGPVKRDMLVTVPTWPQFKRMEGWIHMLHLLSIRYMGQRTTVLFKQRWEVFIICLALFALFYCLGKWDPKSLCAIIYIVFIVVFGNNCKSVLVAEGTS